MKKTSSSRASISRQNPSGNRASGISARAGGSIPAVRAGEEVFSGPARSILRGELDRIGLPTLLTILEMERRSGLLVLSRPRQLGRLHLRDGHIIRARIAGARRQNGPEAVYQMLTWGDGQFELWHTEIEGRDEIRQRTTYLLMEGMRRLDEGRGADSADSVGPGGADGDALLVF
jgi:hypothetical protein